MGVLKQAGVTNADVKMVADMISVLGNAMSQLEYNASGTDSVKQMAEALSLLGSIPSEVIDNINRLSNADFYSIKQMFSAFNDIGGLDDLDNLDSFVDFVKRFSKADSSVLAGFINSFRDMKPEDAKKVRNAAEAFRVFSSLNGESILSNLQDIEQALTPEVAGQITLFLGVFNAVTKESVMKAQMTASAIQALGQINAETIDNISRLGDIDFSVADDLVQFLNQLDFSRLGIFQDGQMMKNMNQLGQFMQQLNQILQTADGGLTNFFMPLKARNIGKSIAIFFEEIVNAIPQKKIEVQMNGIGQLFAALLPLVADDSKYSIRRMKKLLNQ